MNTYRETEHLRAIFVKYLSPTKTRGERLKFKDQRNGESKILKFYDNLFSSIQEQSYIQLIESGFNIVGRASTKQNFIFLVDNWDENYVSVKEIINSDKIKIYDN